MPNWCGTDIIFYSNNKEQLKTFYEKFDEIYNGKATIENGFGNGWLGDFVNTLIPEEYENIRCRGSVDFYEEIYHKTENIDYFRIYTQTAWAPMLKMWRLIIEKYFPSVKIAYCAEECGMEIYDKYDESGLFLSEYYATISAYDDDDGEYYSDYFDSKKELVDYLNETFGVNVGIEMSNENMENIIKKNNCSISINIYEYADTPTDIWD